MRALLLLIFAGCASSEKDTLSDASDADTDTDTDTDTDSDTDTDTDTDADTDTDTDTDPSGLNVALPGNGNGNCDDQEPNDDPSTAVPCGQVRDDGGGTSGLYLNNSGTVDPVNDPLDYFSFSTANSVTSSHEFAYWYSNRDVLDFSIYEVTNKGATIVEVVDFSSTDPAGEPPGYQSIPMDGDTWYLLEIRAVEGGEYEL